MLSAQGNHLDEPLHLSVVTGTRPFSRKRPEGT